MIVCYHCLLFVSLEKFLLKQDLCHCNKRLLSYEAETQTDQKLTNCRIDNVDETQHRTSRRIEHEPIMFFRSRKFIVWNSKKKFFEVIPLCPQEHWYYNYSWYWLDTNLDNLVKLLLFLYNFLQMTIIQYYCPGTLYRVLLGQKYYSLKNRLFYSMSEACCWLVAGKCWIQTCECPYYMR